MQSRTSIGTMCLEVVGSLGINDSEIVSHPAYKSREISAHCHHASRNIGIQVMTKTISQGVIEVKRVECLPKTCFEHIAKQVKHLQPGDGGIVTDGGFARDTFLKQIRRLNADGKEYIHSVDSDKNTWVLRVK